MSAQVANPPVAHAPAGGSPAVSLRRFAPASACDEHGYHQVVLGFEGAMDMLVDGVDQRIDYRHAWLIPAGSRHEYAGVGLNRQLVLDLPPASVAVPERLFARACVVKLDVTFVKLVQDIAAERLRSVKPSERSEPARSDKLDEPIEPNARSSREAASPLTAWDAASTARATLRDRLFAWRASTQLTRALAAAHDIDTPAAGLDFRRIDSWLRAHLCEPLRVEDLATHCGLGVRRFHQLFVEAFGVTPHRYLQRLRLDVTLSLLRDPRNSLADVALAVGFGDQSAFTHAFTRRFGLAPGQWRALCAG